MVGFLAILWIVQIANWADHYQLTYSYLNRSLWTGVGNAVTSAGPHAEDSMIHASMRYYIP